MKKLISLALALVMVFSLATVSLAETLPDGSTVVAEGYTTAVELTKLYTTIGQKDALGSAVDPETLYPTETLSFSATYIGGPIEETDDVKAPLISIATLNTSTDVTVDEDSSELIGNMLITLPVYDTIGEYTYEIEEIAGDAEGVTYSSNKVTVTVLVAWNDAHNDLVSNVYLTDTTSTDNSHFDGKNGAKNDTFKNELNLGELDITKEVTGNLASQDAYFKIIVNFTTSAEDDEETDYVRNDILVNGAQLSWSKSEEVEGETVTTTNPTVISAGAGWSSKRVEIWLKHGETVKFYNVPSGVSYTVSEDSSHLLASGANVSANSDPDVEYTCTISGGDNNNGTGTVNVNDLDAVTLQNAKSTQVETGITLDTLPFVLILAVCAGAVVLFVVKRRRSTEF